VTGFVRRAVVAAALLAVPAVLIAAGASSAPAAGSASALAVPVAQGLSVAGGVGEDVVAVDDVVVEPAIAAADVTADFTPVKSSKKKASKKKAKKKPAKKKAPAPAPVQAAPAPAPVADSGAYSSIEDQVIALTNQQRAANGCAALRTDSRLTVAARAHSTDMVTHNFFSHTGSDGSDFVTREARAGYSAASAENIAWGWSTAEIVVREWMNSPGHRANILNCGNVAVGVGLVKKADGTPYWTQDFGRS
jgi:uncharacterized protein YkwD